MQPAIQKVEEEALPEQYEEAALSSAEAPIELFASVSSVALARFSLLLLLLGLIIGSWTIFDIQKQQKDRRAEVLTASIGQIKAETNRLSKNIRVAEPIVDNLVADLESGSLSLEALDRRLKRDLSANTWMYGLGLAFEPYEVDPQVRLKSHYFVLGADNELKPAPVLYDYTEFKHEWYRKSLFEGKRWNEPYFGEASQELIAEYGAPFWLPGKNKASDEPSGVVFGNLSTGKLKNLVAFEDENISYFYILSKEGRFIVHPDEDLVNSGVSIFERAWSKEDPALNSMAIHALRGESGFIDHVDTQTKDKSWIIFEPLEGLDWSLATVYDKERLGNQDILRQQWFRVITCFTAVLVSFVALLAFMSTHHVEKRFLWASLSASLFVFLGIAAFWWVADYYPELENDGELKVMSSSVLKEFENEQKKIALDLFIAEPKFVSTGVYLQSVEFAGANNVKITAYVWQRYQKGLHKGLSRGFILPEAESPSIEEAYRDVLDPSDPGCLETNIQLRDCGETIGWYVSANLRQEFEYAAYPLDSQKVWLRFWHQAFKDNVILVPDLSAYTIPNPELKPGVQQGFVLPGWDIQSSWFSVNYQSFNTDFGHVSHSTFNNKPELYYNLNIQRKFLNPFVSRIIPIFLVAILMFLIVLISTKSSRVSEWLGFSASDVVLGLSALFFVVVINHSELRQSLQSPSIMYFEYFYFVTYTMLLFVAVSAVYIAKSDAIEGKDENLVSKIMYWPALSVALFIVTYWVFY